MPFLDLQSSLLLQFDISSSSSIARMDKNLQNFGNTVIKNKQTVEVDLVNLINV